MDGICEGGLAAEMADAGGVIHEDGSPCEHGSRLFEGQETLDVEQARATYGLACRKAREHLLAAEEVLKKGREKYQKGLMGPEYAASYESAARLHAAMGMAWTRYAQAVKY